MKVKEVSKSAVGIGVPLTCHSNVTLVNQVDQVRMVQIPLGYQKGSGRCGYELGLYLLFLLGASLRSWSPIFGCFKGKPQGKPPFWVVPRKKKTVSVGWELNTCIRLDFFSPIPGHPDVRDWHFAVLACGSNYEAATLKALSYGQWIPCWCDR